MMGLCIVVGVALFCGLIFTPIGKVIGKSAKNLFIADAMSNPKAAEAVYLTAIEEEQKQYKEAADVYGELSGQLIELSTKYNKSQKKLKDIESKCEQLAKMNDDEGLKLMAEKRQMLIETSESYLDRLQELKPLVEEAKNISQLHEENITKLKQHKDLKVSELKLTSNMTNLYSKMDKLRDTSTTNKLLGHIDTNIEKQKRLAAGSKAIYENELETKERKLDQKFLLGETEDYINQLKSKYR